MSLTLRVLDILTRLPSRTITYKLEMLITTGRIRAILKLLRLAGTQVVGTTTTQTAYLLVAMLPEGAEAEMMILFSLALKLAARHTRPTIVFLLAPMRVVQQVGLHILTLLAGRLENRRWCNISKGRNIQTLSAIRPDGKRLDLTIST